MLRLKHFFIISFILASLTSPLFANSNGRADHQKLKKFLDCQRKGEKDCELEKPQRVKAKNNPKKQVEVDEKKQTQSQVFIFSPNQKRANKGKASSR